MPDRFHRYAVYYLPPPGPLAEFGAAWLGWDAEAGRPRAHPALRGLPRPVEELTATARKYGFHATIKPPFHLAPGTDADGLAAALAALCARLAPVSLPTLRIAPLGQFLALQPDAAPDGVAALAAEIVRDLDGFRAPPSPEELARRLSARLTEAQERNLIDWGYPYVMDEFRFHLTLTCRLTADEQARARAVLAPCLEPLLADPVTIDTLCLMGSDAAGRFHLIERFALGRP